MCFWSWSSSTTFPVFPAETPESVTVTCSHGWIARTAGPRPCMLPSLLQCSVIFPCVPSLPPSPHTAYMFTPHSSILCTEGLIYSCLQCSYYDCPLHMGTNVDIKCFSKCFAFLTTIAAYTLTFCLNSDRPYLP